MNGVNACREGGWGERAGGVCVGGGGGGQESNCDDLCLVLTATTVQVGK